jgi:hypothetical protein
VRGFTNSFRCNKGGLVESGAEQWKKYQLAADKLLERIPSSAVFLMRYEDLCQDPKAWQKKLYDFLGVQVVDPPITVNSYEHHVIGNRMRLNKTLTIRLDDKWKKALTEKEISLILNIAGETNERFGYSR